MRCSSECCEISQNCFDSSDGSLKQAHVIRRGDQPAVPLHGAHPAHQGGGAQAGGAAEQEQRGPGDRRPGAGAGGQAESRRTWGPVSARCGQYRIPQLFTTILREVAYDWCLLCVESV